MLEKIIEDNNYIIKAFENNNISIIHENTKGNSKKIYYFKASDIGKALGIINIHSTIQNYDDDERVIRKAYDPNKILQNTTFLSSQGVYHLLYNSKKDIAKKFRKWSGNILDDIIFNESMELKKLLEDQTKLLKLKDINIETLNKEKTLERHNILLREFSNIGSINYIIKVKSYHDNSFIIRLGESRIGIKDRFSEHKQNYGNAIILDCFIVKKSKDFESFLHNHDDIKFNRVKNLIGHENEKELFLIGKDLSYNQLLNIIKQNIKYFNDDYHDLEKIKLENKQLQIMQTFNKNDFKNFFTTILDNNKLLNDKIDNLEKMIKDLGHKVETISTKTTNNFNEPLVNLGPRVQQINPETLQLIKVYECATQCIKENTNIKRSSLNKAVIENTIYQNYRWLFIDRQLDKNIINNIKPTKITKIQNIGYIAKLNIEKNEILKVYLDRKSAAISNKYSSNSSLDTIVKNCTLSNGNYYILYNELSEQLKNKYKIPILYKDGIGKYKDNKLIEEFTCKLDCVVNNRISNKTLTKALTNGLIYNNFYYKKLGKKLECIV